MSALAAVKKGIEKLIDRYGRDIYYLRMSLTERCNLKCIYCRSESEYCKAKTELTADQYSTILNGLVSLGIRKVRVTGGEPLVRKDLERIISDIASHEEIREICMTTNGIGLSERLPELKQAGLQRLNISMDTLDPDLYRKMTRGGDLAAVLKGIEMAQSLEMPVKINAVVVRGKNDQEAERLISLAKESAIDIRFIELMPMGVLGEDKNARVRNEEILRRHPELRPLPPAYPSQPSMDYTADGFKGKVGFISPVSHKFCNVCNRVRLTSDGKLRMCLANNYETDLMPYLQSGEELLQVMQAAMFNKPECHTFEEAFHTSRTMNQIGG